VLIIRILKNLDVDHPISKKILVLIIQISKIFIICGDYVDDQKLNLLKIKIIKNDEL
jgi:hypothetical protein